MAQQKIKIKIQGLPIVKKKKKKPRVVRLGNGKVKNNEKR